MMISEKDVKIAELVTALEKMDAKLEARDKQLSVAMEALVGILCPPYCFNEVTKCPKCLALTRIAELGEK